MNKVEFNEKALYQFILDVNEFGPQVAAELLIQLLKARASETKITAKAYPPDNYSICSRTGGDHMWGGAHCRHCDIPWPDEYRDKP